MYIRLVLVIDVDVDYIKYYAYFLPKLDISTRIEILLPICVYPNPPCQLPCGRTPVHPEKTHDFRQSVD